LVDQSTLLYLLILIGWLLSWFCVFFHDF
jgi:hypothetical protein